MSDGDRRDDPKIGNVLNGTYRLESVIGTGGMGTVYLAKHVHLGTEFAVKSLVPQFTDNEEAVKRFQREAQISSQLGHPNIVHVIDFNYDDRGTPYMVMDLLKGETLRARLVRKGRLTIEEALPLVKQLCDGLAAAHLRNVVHRDLKPENLFICEKTDQLKVLDFGVSKIRGSYNTQLTRPMAMLGTPYYMSPEQAMGNTADVDMLSDVWAVGAIVYEALTGGGAFAADNPVAVFYKIVNEPFPAASANGADVSKAVDRVLEKACAKAPAERFQTTLELYQELVKAAFGNANDETRPTTVPEARAKLGIMEQPTQPGGDLPAQATRLFKDQDKTPDPLPSQPTQIFKEEDKTPAPLPSQPTQIFKGDEKKVPLAAEATRLINAPPAYPVGKAGLSTQMIPGQGAPVSAKVARALAGSALGKMETSADADEPEFKTLTDDVSLSEEERTALNERPKRPIPTGDETAQLVMPPESARPQFLSAPTVTKPPAKHATPVIAGETRATKVGGPTLSGRLRTLPRWQLAAVGAGVFIAVAAISATVATTRRQTDRNEARGRIEEAMAGKRWGDAERELKSAVGSEGESAELTAVGKVIAEEKGAEERLKAGRELRSDGDLVGAMAELGHIDRKSVYASEAAQERKAVVKGWEELLDKAVHERRCADAVGIVKRLSAIDGRATPAAVTGCHEKEREGGGGGGGGGGSAAASSAPTVGEAAKAYRRRDYDHAFSVAQAVVRGNPSEDAAWRILGSSACMIGSVDEAKRARGHLGNRDQRDLDKLCRTRRIVLVEAKQAAAAQPAVEPAGTLVARDTMTKMMITADPFARKCFVKTPGYKTPMKLRVTAFPGSDHFVATAVSTGPIEIRSCLEGLFKTARPPAVAGAISAERVYSPSEE